MESIRNYWPVVLAAALVVSYLIIVFGRKGAGLSRFEIFRTRNQDGLLGIAVLGIMLLLLAGGQLMQNRTAAELTAISEESESNLKRLRQTNQEWSLKFRSLSATHDSLQLALELDRELRSMTPLEGMILDGKTRQAIEGARITLARHDPSMKKRVRVIAEDVVSDGSGRFRILVPALGPRGTIRAEVEAEGYSPEQRWLTDISSDYALEILLSP